MEATVVSKHEVDLAAHHPGQMLFAVGHQPGFAVRLASLAQGAQRDRIEHIVERHLGAHVCTAQVAEPWAGASIQGRFDHRLQPIRQRLGKRRDIAITWPHTMH